jgi:hypothetical protein
LSAFIVLKRRRRRWGPGVWAIDFEVLCKAVKARVWWAMLGGLKEESRMRRVWGWVVGGAAGWGVRLFGWTDWRRRKVEEEDWKSFRAAERWPGSDLYIERVDAMMGNWMMVRVGGSGGSKSRSADSSKQYWLFNSS